MTQHLYGLHDPGGEYLFADAKGWIVFTEAIGCDPNDKSGRDYSQWSSAGYGALVRLNNGYGSAGTIPTIDKYDAFAQRVANFIAASKGCDTWLIGNEPNHSQERPNGQSITPAMYIDCFKRVFAAARAQAGTRHGLIPAPVAPWNVETGDWLEYQAAIWQGLWQLAGGVAIHTYSDGPSPASITSQAKMDAPYQQRFYGFQAYRDFMVRVPLQMRGLPVYITETDQDSPWVNLNSGWVQAAYAEIDRWNQTDGTQKIYCLCLYRWPNADQWGIVDKQNVHADLRAAVAKGYPSPVVGANSMPDTTFIPSISNGTPTPTLPPRQFDPLAKARGVTVDTPAVQSGQQFWFAKTIQWYDEKKSQGRHHIYGDVYKDGAKAAGVPLTVNWPSGASQIKTEDKSSDLPPFNYWYNYPMSPSLNEFSIRVSDGMPSETVRGIGMGADGNSHIHTSTVVEWSLETMPAAGTGTPPTQPSTPVTPPVPPSTGAGLLWPVHAPITQYFGPHGIDYPGVPGHDGLDFGVPQGTQVLAVSDGKVMWVDNDPAGFGLYVRIYHPAYGFHSFMGHLSKQLVQPGQMVKRGEVVALSGSTGNSTGPHLHFSTRLGSENAYYDLHDGYHSGQANPLAVYALLNYRDPNGGQG